MAEPKIEPESFDIIVLGSGLTECLIASAAVKAGKSVLLVDHADTYGSEYASFCTSSFETRSLTPGSPANIQATNSAESTVSEAATEANIESNWRRVELPIPDLPFLNYEQHFAPGWVPGAACKQYILDLAPKLLYQGEELVDFLVATRAHNYVDFKLVEGSYLLHQGQLRAVPASKGDIFKDKGLGLGDKRVLMKFINGCVAAAQQQQQQQQGVAGAVGTQPQGWASDPTPLVDVLKGEGLSRHLRDLVLYGIAMCDHTQEPPESSQQQQAASAADSSGRSSSVVAAGSEAPGGNSSSSGNGSSQSRLLTAAEGVAALQLLMQSMNRFGQPGAFMMPAYGCGSLSEAFVRFCAVNGAVTVLRQRVCAALMQDAADGEQGSNSGSSNSRCKAVVTSAGQVLTCGTLVGNSRVLEPLTASSSTSSAQHQQQQHEVVSRAAVVLDRSLLPGLSSLTLCIAPGAEGVGNKQPIRGIQLGSSSCVCPSGRYLLYLSTRATASSALEDLQAAVAALVDTSQLCPVKASFSSQQPAAADSGSSSGGAAAAAGRDDKAAAEAVGTSSSNDSTTTSAPTTSTANQGTASSSTSQPRPQALAIYYYQQALYPALHPDSLPPNVACCASPDASLASYVATTRHAQQLCSAQLPGVPWLSELQPEAGTGHESEDDAVDDLQAAVGSLQQAAAASAAT